MSEQINKTTSKSRRWQWLALAVLLLIAAFALLWLLDQQNQRQAVAVSEKNLPQVTVLELSPATHRARVAALSEAKARNSAELRTQTAGQIMSLSEDFLPGKQIQRGTVLVQLQDDSQQTLVAEAANRLAQAQLALLTEERMAATAERNWQLSANGEQAASPLVLRKPQLQAARAEQQAAAAALAEAKSLLRNTAVRAPFDGVIDRRDVSLGETVDVGQSIGVVVDQQTVDVTVHLNNHDWSLLPDTLASLEVSLHNPFTEQSWPAQVRGRSGVVDQATRLRRLYLEHKRAPNDSAPLLPGTYVKVLIQGVLVDDTLKVPESALTRDSAIWSVGADDRLLRHEAKRVFSRDGAIFVSIPGLTGADTIRVVRHPLAGFVVGDRVQARVTTVSE
ncbi:MAG: efflux RND transporter periplasmic adaptor subunit [Cellvibrionaceae bacterium]|nr:efflux RND transporter periplasmic adaptor subunit [Cellvibrionaceae bacterium]